MLIPLLGTYLLILGMIAVHARQVPQARALVWVLDRARSSPVEPGAGPRATHLLRYVIALMALGYLGFLALVDSYYAVVAGQTPRCVH